MLSVLKLFILPILITTNQLNPSPNMYLFGDSLANGLSKPLKQQAKDAKTAFHSRAVNGSTMNRWDKSINLNYDLNYYKPNIILVSLGTNDMKSSNMKETKKRFNGLVSRLEETKAKVFWIIPPKMPFPDNGIRSMLDSLPSTFVKISCDDSILERSADKIHFTSSGYSEWSKCVWSHLGNQTDTQ